MIFEGAGEDAEALIADERYKQATLKNCETFADCINEINNT